MDPLLITAASGMRARMESLDMLANNLANTATAGYKADREFYSLYMAPETGGEGAQAPLVEKPWTDFSAGTLTPTGNPLDLALTKPGFFAVNGPSGILYTRNGSFRLTPAGVLSTAEGYPVRTVGGQTIQSQSSSPLEIAPDGTVRQDGAALGQIAVADFDVAGAVAKFGRSYFQATDPNAAPAAAKEIEVRQGSLETSNVGAPESAVRLVSLMRQFEMLQKAIILGGEMNRRALEEVARVGS
jgi:flagellar basal-body rod protein FlgF